MNIFVLTLFPQMILDFSNYGIIKKSLSEGLTNIKPVNLRDFCHNGQVDSPSYGGGPGMVIKAEPVKLAIESLNLNDSKKNKVVLLSPQGAKLNNDKIKSLSQLNNLVLISGRYEGFDERISTLVDEEVSVCDFVTNGGEIPALALIEGVVRYVPRVLGDQDSLVSESFCGDLLDHPHYTRPRVWDGKSVPQVLLDGNHLAIKKWRRDRRLISTFLKRPDLLKLSKLSPEEKLAIEDFFFEINN